MLPALFLILASKDPALAGPTKPRAVCEASRGSCRRLQPPPFAMLAEPCDVGAAGPALAAEPLVVVAGAKPGTVAIRFAGPLHPAAEDSAVRWAAAHDRQPSAVVSTCGGVFLVNGPALAGSVSTGDSVRIGSAAGHLLTVDDGAGEVSPSVARALDAARIASAANDRAAQADAYAQALTLAQDADELLSIAEHAAAAHVDGARTQAYVRAVDLAADARKTLAVAEHAARHGAVDDARAAYAAAVRRANRRSALQAIAESAARNAQPAAAAAARAKALALP
jgi:hypothetical protein